MARILGAVASSHTPTIGFALDTHKQEDPAWAPIFEATSRCSTGWRRRSPTCCSSIFNDHVTSFFFDHYSRSRSASASSTRVADEGGGARALPPVEGHPALAHHIAAALVADEFDMSFFQDKPLDHGCFSPLSMLWPHEPAWPAAIVPLQVGVLEFPDSRRRGAATSSAGAAQSDRELSRGPQGGDRRHRRAVAPGPRRALRLQQPGVGPAVPRSDRERSRAADRDDTCRVRRRSAAWKAPRSSCGW